MKTRHKKIDNQLYNLFKDVITDEDEINEAIKDAKKAFLLVQQDVVYKEQFLNEEP